MSRLTTKPTKWHVPSLIRVLLSAWRKLGSLATHWAHSEDWSDWADLSLRWSHSHFVGFVRRWLIYGFSIHLSNQRLGCMCNRRFKRRNWHICIYSLKRLKFLSFYYWPFQGALPLILLFVFVLTGRESCSFTKKHVFGVWDEVGLNAACSTAEACWGLGISGIDGLSR